MISKQSTFTLRIEQLIWNQEKISNRPVFFKILAPLLLTIIGSAIKLACFNQTDQVPFLLFFGVIIISAAYGGSFSAWWAVVFSIISALFFFVIPWVSQGHVVHALFKLFVFTAEAAAITWFIQTMQLIQLKLKGSETRFRNIIEKSEEGFFMTNDDGRIIYTSPSVKNILGYTENELHDLDYFSLLSPDDMKDFRFSFIKLLSGKTISMQVKHRVKTKNDAWIWIESAVNNLLADDGVKALVFHFRNVNEQVIDEQHREDFVHIASHELKNPITALKGYMQMLKRRVENAENLQTITRMERQVDKLLSLIADMLDTTKIKAGELQYHYSLFNLVDCIKECADAVKCVHTGYTINCTFHSHVALVKADRNRISQVITNLLTNAIKYSPNDPRIEIVLTADNNKMVCSITDYGIGIAPDKQKKIFDRFYRVDTLPKGKFQGLGLGLFITAEIVNEHRGEIGVKSEEQQGSTFWFSLPV